jgi:serine/threonine-protein kinase
VSADRQKSSGGSDKGLPRSPGAIVGDRYRILHVIARGGTGVVYEAEHTWTGRRVALKMLLPRLVDGERQIQRFRQEAKSAARITHPNIVDVLDMGCDGDDRALFLVHGLLVGEDLEQRLERPPPIGPAEVLKIFLPILDALRVAHEHGVLHRDIKPSNIFLVASGGGEFVPKLIDFGAVKLLDEGADMLEITRTGYLVGTPLYMSPEQLRGEPLDARSDVWSLGVVMHRALAGRVPFDTSSFAALAKQILGARAPRIEQPGVPRQLADVVHRALATDRDERFPTVAAMMGALEDDRPDVAPCYLHGALEAPPDSDEATIIDGTLPPGLRPDEREAPREKRPSARTRAAKRPALFEISDELTNVPAENERIEAPADERAPVRVIAEPTPTPAPHAIRRAFIPAAPLRHVGRRPWRGHVRMGLVAASRSDGDVIRRLQQRIEGLWSLKRFPSYGALVDALSEEEVELAWLPPVAYLRARRLGPVHLLLALERSGKASYGSALVASERSGIKELPDLRGKHVAWVDVWSAAGYLMPRSVLREAGLDPAQVFASQNFVGSHRAVLDAVQEGRADVGATYCTLDEQGALVAAPWSDRAGLRPIALSGAIPGDTICAAGELPLEDAESMVEPLLALSTNDEGAALLRELFGTGRFAEADPSYYQVLEGV